jgi:hypothetical protein
MFLKTVEESANEEWKIMLRRRFRTFGDRRALMREVLDQYSKRARRRPRLVGRHSATPARLAVVGIRKFVSRYCP